MKDDNARVSDKLTKQQDTIDLQAAAIDALQKTLPSSNEMYGNGPEQGRPDVTCWKQRCVILLSETGTHNESLTEAKARWCCQTWHPQRPVFQHTTLQ